MMNESENSSNNCDTCNKNNVQCPRLQNELDSDITSARISRDNYCNKRRKRKYCNRISLDLTFSDSYRRQSDSADSTDETDEDEEDQRQHSDKVISEFDIKLNRHHENVTSNNYKEINKTLNKLKMSNDEENIAADITHNCFMGNYVLDCLKSIKTKEKDPDIILDSYTRLQLYKLIKGQFVEKINGLLFEECDYFYLHGNCKPSHSNTATECIIKIFTSVPKEIEVPEMPLRTKPNCKFLKRLENKAICMWAEKEMRNLLRLKKAGVRCPQPIFLKRHILALSFDRDNCCSAPRLKYAQLGPNEYETAYNQIVEAMKSSYRLAGLVHGDLSEKNVIWYNKHCYFINVAQSVEVFDDDALTILFNDCWSISRYFTSNGLQHNKSPEELFMEITGLDFNNKIIMEEKQKLLKTKFNDLNSFNEYVN